MLRRVRNRLRQIRYYSAHRPRTVFTQMFDIAMFATLLLAFPITWLANVTAVRQRVALVVPGQITRTADGAIAAVLTQPQSTVARAPTRSGETIEGNFTLTVTDRAQGWPLTTSITRLPARIDLDLLDEVKPRPNANLGIDDPLRRAIAQSIAEDGQHEALEAWALEEPRTRQHWISWVIATGAWWMMLVFAAATLIQIARFITLFVLKHQVGIEERRLKKGLCVHCGYDMRGLEFNERCPECGEFVW